MDRKNKSMSTQPSQRKTIAKNTELPPAELQSRLQQGMALLQSGRLPEAEQLFQSVLAVDRNNVSALQLLGIIFSQKGMHQEGESLLRRAIKEKPKIADLHYNLGLVLDQQGKVEQAVKCYREALRQGLVNEWVYNNLGIVLSKLERMDEAEAFIRKALEINPNNTSALSNLGLILWKTDRLGEAEKELLQALEIDPRYVDALTNMGIINLAKKKADEAAGYLRRAIEIDAQNFNAVNNLASALLYKDEDDDALVMIRRALELCPESTDAMCNMAKVFLRKGNDKEAEATYLRVLEIKPKDVGALVELGHILTTQGRFDMAKERFQTALDVDPKCIGARVGLIDIDQPDIESEDISDLEKLFRNFKVSKEDKIRASFCLAKNFENGGAYKKAFGYLSEGNHIKRGEYEYDLESDRRLFGRIKDDFSQVLFKEHADSGLEEKMPIFILGMPRSGTSLTEQILASHPQVYGAGELSDLRRIIKGQCGEEGYERFPEIFRRFGQVDLSQVGEEYIHGLRSRDNTSERVTDKMPHNFLYVGIIRLILPNAKIIHCRRDPMDNCLSIYKQNFTGLHEYAYDLGELGSYYLLYQDLMEHWHNVLPGFLFDLQYEDMVADQEGMTRRLLEFCDLPWDENCLQFHKSRRTVSTASKYQVRKKIYSDSVKLWKQYEQELQPLADALASK